MPPTVRSDLIVDNSTDDGVQASMACNQLVTVVAAGMKEAIGCVVHEPVHRIRAVNQVEREIADARRAIWKCRHELAHCHVVIGKSFNQRHSAIFFRQAKLSDRYKIAGGPCAGNSAECKGEAAYCGDGKR